MNPVDHPMGGGEGRSSGGRKGSFSPWGWYTKVRLDPPPLATACSVNALIVGIAGATHTQHEEKLKPDHREAAQCRETRAERDKQERQLVTRRMPPMII